MSTSPQRTLDAVCQTDSTADVTVIIPFFNSSATLTRALDSVMWQTRPPKDVIIIDDGSTQREAQAARDIIVRYQCARMLVMPANAGAGQARNLGWDSATTEWVAFLDCDDAWHPRKLEAQLECANAFSEPPALVACQSSVLPDLDSILKVSAASRGSARFIDLRALLIKNRLPTSAVLLRRELKVRFPARRYAEDWELWLRVAALARPMITLDGALVGRFKRAYGEAGLSADIGRMISGEFVGLRQISRDGTICASAYFFGFGLLAMRVMRRLAIIGLRRVIRP